MKCANAVLLAMLMLTACATPSTPVPAGNPAAAPAANAASGCPVATPDGKIPSMGLESQVILGCLPAPAPQTEGLKARYPDKAAFLAELKAMGTGIAVDLDGQSVRGGFGPAVRYHTNQDGSVSR